MPHDTSSSGSSPTSKTLARHIAPFAPLALALLMTTVPPSTPTLENAAGEGPGTGIAAVKCDEVADSQDCHSRFPTGCSAGGQYDAYLNYWKNQLIDPATASTPVKYFTKLSDYQKLDASIPSGLTKNNQGQFQNQLQLLGEGQLYGIVGYLYYFQHTGAESSNCDLTGPPGDANYGNVDYHIGIGFDPGVAQQLRSDAAGAPAATSATATASKKRTAKRPTSSGSGASTLQQTSVIVEMTPQDRFQYENNIWTLDNLKLATGRQVRVVGQLIIDNEHNLTSQNCAKARTAADKQTCWRASVWELHPVVRFQVCPNDSCGLDATDWVELDQLQ
jgi:hypothetical protein